MVNYWKSKVLPSIKKVFENPKKALAAESCKLFDEAKEGYSQEFEDKKTELQPKVLEIYEACPPEIKGLIKEPKDSGLKKNSAAVKKFLDDLATIEFPGSKAVSEACTKSGPGYLSGPITFVFEKISTFVVVPENKTEEVVEAPPAAEKTEGESGSVVAKEKEIVVEAPPAEPTKPEEPAKSEEPKVEEAPAPAPAPAPTPAVEPSKP